MEGCDGVREEVGDRNAYESINKEYATYFVKYCICRV